MDKIQLIAYYLPQFYEIEFNNNYWGKGYTEWTATANAKPLFKGHYQPHVPADLGFYNLLMPEAQIAQAKMAKEYGIDGFCYWHYWFGNGKTIMEKPFENMLKNKKVDIPFCLAWANHNWHNPSTKELILEQTYPGVDDYIEHFNYLLPAFRDERYMKVDGKLIFVIYAPPFVPDLNVFIDLWNDLALKNGLKGFYFVGSGQTKGRVQDYLKYKLSAVNTIRLHEFKEHRSGLYNRWCNLRNMFLYSTLDTATYAEASQYFLTEEDSAENVIPTIVAGWDHTPRTGRKALILTNYTPNVFREHVEHVLSCISKKENKLCFIKSWNEWAEGNALEPDLKYGLGFLKSLKAAKEKYQQ